MAGKGILIVTIAFGAIILLFGHNFIATASRTLDNSTNYEIDSRMSNLVISGVEYGMNLVYQNPLYEDNSTFSFSDGNSINIDVENLPGSIKRVTCTATTSWGKYSEYTSRAILRAESWANYAYYSQNEGAEIRFYTNDVITGPLHTQDPDGILVDGTPTFNGEVSLLASRYREANPGRDRPRFNQGIHYNIDKPLDGLYATNSTDVYNSASIKISPPGSNNTVILEYLANNNVRYRVDTKDKRGRTVEGDWEPSVNLANINPPVIGVSNAVLRVRRGSGSPTITNEEGLTLVCKGTGGFSDAGEQTLSGNGHILIDDNIIRSSESNGKIGLVAENNILVSELYGDKNQDITIQAAMYAEKGGFGIENIIGHPSYSGKKIRLRGSLIQNIRRIVSRIGSKGYDKDYIWEEDMAFNTPPKFPGSGAFTVASYVKVVEKTPRR